VIVKLGEDATDALNFNNLVISAEGATNPIAMNDLHLNFFFNYSFKKYCT
jgi:hypothetical protein